MAVKMYALVGVKNVLQLPEAAVSLVLKQIVTLQFVLDKTVLKFSSLFHLMEVVYQVYRIWVFVNFFFTQLFLCNLSNAFFHLFYSSLKDLYVHIQIFWYHLVLHIISGVVHVCEYLNVILSHVQFLSQSSEAHTLIEIASNILGFR